MNQDEMDLLHGYLNDTLSEADFARLQTLLRANAEARRVLRSLTTVDAKLHQLAAANPATLRLLAEPIGMPSQVSDPVNRIGWLSWYPLAAAAALVIFAVTGALLWVGHREPTVLTLVDSSGSIAWNHNGRWRMDVVPGQRLAAGTIETVGESVTAMLRFHDGTLLTLSGGSEMSFSDDGQKVLVLRKGSLSAQVKPQPKNKPMLVRTATAEAQVVGTVFNIDTRTDDTLLKVDEGLVKLKRLADGSTVDVPAKSSAVAALDSASTLNSSTTPEPLNAWSFDFTTTEPPQIWRGIWQRGIHGGMMVSSPYVAMQRPDGSVLTHFGVSVRAAHLNPPLSLVATKAGWVRYRLRQDRPMPLQILLLTLTPDGNYGGNFSAKLSPQELRTDADGWCNLEVPISRFEPADRREHIRRRHPSPVGHVLKSVLLNSYEVDSKLTVARFELGSEPSR